MRIDNNCINEGLQNLKELNDRRLFLNMDKHRHFNISSEGDNVDIEVILDSNRKLDVSVKDHGDADIDIKELDKFILKASAERGFELNHFYSHDMPEELLDTSLYKHYGNIKCRTESCFTFNICFDKFRSKRIFNAEQYGYNYFSEKHINYLELVASGHVYFEISLNFCKIDNLYLANTIFSGYKCLVHNMIADINIIAKWDEPYAQTNLFMETYVKNLTIYDHDDFISLGNMKYSTLISKCVNTLDLLYNDCPYLYTDQTDVRFENIYNMSYKGIRLRKDCEYYKDTDNILLTFVCMFDKVYFKDTKKFSEFAEHCGITGITVSKDSLVGRYKQLELKFMLL